MFWCCLFHSSSGFSGSWCPLPCCPGICLWLLEVPQRADNRNGPWITWLWSRTGRSTSKPGQRHRREATCWPNCWSRQLGEPVFLCRGGTAMLCMPREAPWCNSTSFSLPASFCTSVGIVSPSPSLIACSWTLATVCCSQCSGTAVCRTVKWAGLKTNKGNWVSSFFWRGDLNLSPVSSSFLELLQLREQGMTAQGDRGGDRMDGNIFSWLCCQSWQSNIPTFELC